MGVYSYNRIKPQHSDNEAETNSADPDQTAPQEPSDQGLHCLQIVLKHN